MRRLLVLLPLLFVAAVAHAEVPAFTPNVVDPSHHLDAAATAQVNDVLAEMRRQADIDGAVYLADGLDGASIEELAHDAFDTWKLGEAGKDNGLLLVFALADHKMRFEVGYGLEGVLTDVKCQHALDDFVRPQMRAGDTKQAILDGLVAVTRAKLGTFTVAANVHYTPPPAPKEFDAAFGGWVWAGYVALLVGLFAWRRAGKRSWGILAFLALNPGAFVFIGGALLSAHRADVLAELRDLTSPAALAWMLGWVRAHVVLVPFYVAVGIAAAYPVRRFVLRAVALETALLAAHPELGELDDRYLKMMHGQRLSTTKLRRFEIAAAIGAPIAVFVLGIMFELRYLAPVALVAVPLGVLAVFHGAASFGLRRYRSPEAYRAYLEWWITRYTARMEAYVRRGFATRNTDGSYAYTAAYYASSSSSSSSSGGSSFSSSSGGGSSGGGGASSSW